VPAYSDRWPSAASVEELDTRQSGVCSRGQLFACGVSRHRLGGEVRARRWRLAGPRAVLLTGAPPSTGQREWVAVINAGPRAALGGLSAAARDGLTGFPPLAIQVLVPHGTKAAHETGVRLRISRSFDPDRDVHPVRLPPRTRLARSVVDAASWSARPEVACGLLAAAVQQRLVRVETLRDELTLGRQIRRRALLLAILGDIEGGSHSFAEIDAARLFRGAGLPPPVRQAVRTDGTGRRRYLDLYWPELNLCVEIDGGFHRDEAQWSLDMERQNDLVIGGIRVIRIPVITLRTSPATAVAQVRRAMGFAPPDHPAC
jgi:hypothetical protein